MSSIVQDQISLKAFAAKVSEEILSEYYYEFNNSDCKLDINQYTPESMLKYIIEWSDANDLSIEETIAEFKWRTITYELDLF